ncbi:hypothetical protein OUZ56_015974 [Daphnia magna]|uniref:Secreted protein n=1 Tax=Daphnia magna TaxID=35525 RepID=A0ABR0APR2_9CRUS|nr:hypothetical protein OUZ56_015974 [Daphnia magna]
MCFKGFFVKKFTIAFCMWWCFTLSAMPAAQPAACIPAINVPQGILTLYEGHYSLHEHHHPVQCKERPVTESSSTLCCQPSALSIPGIQIYKFLCLANHHPYPSALHCGFSSSLLSLLNANVE